MSENWICLPEEDYPGYVYTKYSCMSGSGNPNYWAEEFTRRYEFGRPIERVRLRTSGDSAFVLSLGGERLLRGPASVGGDFLFNDEPRGKYYAFEIELIAEDRPCLSDGTLDFRAVVRPQPVLGYEYSRGRGGFYLHGEVFFGDGTSRAIDTGDGWTARFLGEYKAFGRFEYRSPGDELVSAVVFHPDTPTITAPIPPCVETELPADGARFIVPAGGVVKKDIEFDRVYAAYIGAVIKTEGSVAARIVCYETADEEGSGDELFADGDCEYIGFELRSVGGVRVTVENKGDSDAYFELHLTASHYPAPVTLELETDDPDINELLDVCRHSLKYCRQTLHLDSPKHCEPLACTGDYYIQTLMSFFSFPDMRLARFDVLRTADLLTGHDGRMFHTSYSLIWVLMLWDVYMITGDLSLLSDSREALRLLLRRFENYVGDNGLIETPPDYMFVDWLYPDGISLHHPPKCLGQTVLNMFYFGALGAASQVYRRLGDDKEADSLLRLRSDLRERIISLLWDDDKGLFIEGLDTPTPEELLGEYMPQNLHRRYYGKHSGILAAYFGLFGDGRDAELIERVINDDSLGDVQPYFMHFLLEAVYRRGLREKYTVPLIKNWLPSLAECKKGLPEGFIPPQQGYRFDHSHAWAGAPLYALPRALLGLEILEPGLRAYSLSPSSLGFGGAKVTFSAADGKTITVFISKEES